jgi:hypothetical protein
VVFWLVAHDINFMGAVRILLTILCNMDAVQNQKIWQNAPDNCPVSWFGGSRTVCQCQLLEMGADVEEFQEAHVFYSIPIGKTNGCISTAFYTYMTK